MKTGIGRRAALLGCLAPVAILGTFVGLMGLAADLADPRTHVPLDNEWFHEPFPVLVVQGDTAFVSCSNSSWRTRGTQTSFVRCGVALARCARGFHTMSGSSFLALRPSSPNLLASSRSADGRGSRATRVSRFRGTTKALVMSFANNRAEARSSFVIVEQLDMRRICVV